jgi:hypothetical protein
MLFMYLGYAVGQACSKNISIGEKVPQSLLERYSL